MVDSKPAPNTEASLTAALEPFGWTCGEEFWRRYHSDPWVFHLANAVERLSGLVVDLRHTCDNWSRIDPKRLDAYIKSEVFVPCTSGPGDSDG